MSVSTDDLKEPDGELDLALLFPDKTTTQAEDDLQTWLDKANAELAGAGLIDQDEIDLGAKAYAYYRAYKSVYQRLSARPISKSLTQDGISVSMTQGQIDSFKQKYIEWERIWVTTMESVSTTEIIAPSTVAVDTEPTF